MDHAARCPVPDNPLTGELVYNLFAAAHGGVLFLVGSGSKFFVEIAVETNFMSPPDDLLYHQRIFFSDDSGTKKVAFT